MSGVRPALDRLRTGAPVFGTLQIIPSVVVTEIAILSGYDFVILDCEHGIVDEREQLASLQVIGASAAFSAVRVRASDHAAVGRYLDLDADAILMPDVRSPAEAAAFVDSAHFGPHGSRSSNGGGARRTGYGLKPERSDPPLLLAMIESGGAVAEIAAIAATPGLSGLVIGPHDLGADLGCNRDFSAPEFVAAVRRIEDAGRDAGLILGGGAYPGIELDRLLEAGHRFILAGSDIAALRRGYLTDLQSAVRDSPQR